MLKIIAKVFLSFCCILGAAVALMPWHIHKNLAQNYLQNGKETQAVITEKYRIGEMVDVIGAAGRPSSGHSYVSESMGIIITFDYNGQSMNSPISQFISIDEVNHFQSGDTVKAYLPVWSFYSDSSHTYFDDNLLLSSHVNRLAKQTYSNSIQPWVGWIFVLIGIIPWVIWRKK